MIIKNANVFGEDAIFSKSTIFIKNDEFSEESKDSLVIDAEGLYAIPGLTDIHFHGCVGYDFCDGTQEAIQAIAQYQLKNGVTTMVPATMTLEEEKLLEICKTAAGYENKSGAVLCGINMEGPFISSAKKGAQNAKHIHKPDVAMFRRLQHTSGGLVKLVDIAPEEEGSMEFITELKDEVRISLAHTAADYEIANEAYARGACHATHLYNAMPAYTHRAPGVIGAACDNKHCYVELICDGIHIHPSAVRTTLKMFTDDRVVLISDSMMATGLTDGDYSLGGQPVKVIGSLATLEDGTIAGSATNLMDCLRTAVKVMGISLESAIKCAAVNSAKAVGIYDKYGSITIGKTANLILLDKDLNIIKIFQNGQEISLL